MNLNTTYLRERKKEREKTNPSSIHQHIVDVLINVISRAHVLTSEGSPENIITLDLQAALNRPCVSIVTRVQSH